MAKKRDIIYMTNRSPLADCCRLKQGGILAWLGESSGLFRNCEMDSKSYYLGLKSEMCLKRNHFFKKKQPRGLCVFVHVSFKICRAADDVYK